MSHRNQKLKKRMDDRARFNQKHRRGTIIDWATHPLESLAYNRGRIYIKRGKSL